MFISKFRLLRPATFQRFFFATRPASLFYYNKRFSHSREYTLYVGDQTADQAIDMAGYCMGAASSKDLAFVYERFPKIPESIISYSFHKLCKFQI